MSSDPWLIHNYAVTSLCNVDLSFHKISFLLGSNPGFFKNFPPPFFIQVSFDGDNKFETWLFCDLSTTIVMPFQQDYNLLESR